MPLVFIHGVNTRREGSDAEGYRAAEARRNELFERLVIVPLVEQGTLQRPFEIVSPYWGDLGVSFRWQQASLPPVEFLEALGAGARATPRADRELAATLTDLGTASAPALEALRHGAGPMVQAARADLPRLVEALLGAIVYGERDLQVAVSDTPEMVGRREALLLIAASQAAHDRAVRQQMAHAASDDAVLDLLKREIVARHRRLLTEAQTRAAEVVAVAEAEPVVLEALGSADRLRAVVTQSGALIDRARGAAGRLASVAALDLWREDLHRNLTRFLGDVFVYLHERDGLGGILSETIVGRVAAGIEQAPRHHPDEPLIVVTHSMGGTIFYDLVSHYAPILKVACWVSVGSQVAVFEEMKLFKQSDRALVAPERVAALRQVGRWLNVYDPSDVLSFLVERVFAGPHDVKLATGEGALKAHGAYFNRPRFYALVLEHVEQALT